MNSNSTDSYVVRGGDIWLHPPQTTPFLGGAIFALGENSFGNGGDRVRRPATPRYSVEPLDDPPFAIRDDFLIGSPATSGSIGALGWSYATGVGTITTSRLASTTGHPGILRITTAAAVNTYGLNLCSTGAQILDPADYFDLMFVARYSDYLQILATSGCTMV